MLNPVELIIKKRSGQILSAEEMKFFVESYINDKIPEYQMSSMLMAIFFQGMEPHEIQSLTKVYIESGRKIIFPESMNTVDKHSTGGVGDKISLMLAPIVVACGGIIPMISGRGLGHTGGTLDKLESIPGFRTDYDEPDFRKIIDEVGFSIICQSKELVPADKRIYALRDVTGTVESLSLITASIMSKKIAEGAQNLVIDLKVGTGAFIKNMENARKLGNLLKTTGEFFGQKVSVIYTNMNSPLGYMIGNGLEVLETIDYLKGNRIPDIHEITKALAVEMLLLSKVFESENEAAEAVEKVIENGKALEVFKNFIIAQNGNGEVCDNPELLPKAKFKIPVISDKKGWISAIDSQGIGYSLIEIDAGRKTLTSKLNYGTGAELYPKIGDSINIGDSMGYIYSDDEELGEKVRDRILECYTFSETEIPKEKIIIDILK